MVRPPPQLSKHQAASKEESSSSLTPSVSDIVWRQDPPLPPPSSRVQSLEKGSNNDEMCNGSWTLRRLKQDMEEVWLWERFACYVYIYVLLALYLCMTRRNPGSAIEQSRYVFSIDVNLYFKEASS